MDRNTAASIARLEAKVDALIIRFDEAITTQVKDHGKRLGVLERRAVWQAGWIAGAGLAEPGVQRLPIQAGNGAGRPYRRHRKRAENPEVL